ncbi:hypothetical protein [Bradyrhizobium cosmicum]|uniref:Uncharacterized protein n=1 Tax=Bradyrhizobium cosmicum TaxID=1404864 RepID=A0AAI8MDF3_9BRAD|nr:hypothetical protein [Bradyrhizobium cosmicum]BAL76017.1 hypothetical protein S23_28050 [Bradyrhizobium cosmicum]
MRVVLAAIITLPLAACGHGGPASIAGGECRIFERPQYEVLGRQPYDQDWIDSQVEGGVGGCNWKRPAQRPPALDAAPVRQTAPAPIKRKSLVRRIRDRVLPPASARIEVAPDVPAPAPPYAPAPPAIEPRPVPPPRSAIEKLLQPRDDD